jgi:hypothetical protein
MKLNVYFLFLALNLCFSQHLFAVNRLWTGNTNTDWSTANNWNPVGVPTASDNVYIRDGTGNPVIATGTTATVTSILIYQKTLTINSGGVLNVRGDGTFYRYVDLNINSTLINHGTLAMETAGGGPVAGIFAPGDDHSLVENYGIIRINSSNNNTAVEMGGPVGGTTSSAIINNYACGQFIVVSYNILLTSIARFNNNGYTFVGGAIANSGGVFTNNGVLKYGSAGTITSNNGSVIVNDNPTNSTIFTYTGTFLGTVNGIYKNANATASAGTFTAPNTFAPSGLSPGEQALYAKITPLGGGCTYIVPFTYTYADPPNFTTSPTTKSVCSGSSTTFTVAASNATGYQWQVNTGGGFTDLSNTTPYSGVTNTTLNISNVAGLNSYQYRCVATGAGGSTNSNSATLTVNPLPTATILTPASTTITCSTPSLSLTATGGGTYRWDNSSTNAVRTVTASGTYSVTITSTGSCTAVDTQVITSNTTAPTANILAPASTTLTCTTTSISLTATGGGTYRWDNSSTSATRTVTTAGTYSVTVTAPNGCTAVDTQVISGNTTAPTANILTPASTTLTCTTTSLSLTATGGGTYRWDNSSTSATRTITTAGTYSVTVTAPNGCTAVDSQVISGNTTAPTANILAPASTTLTCTTTSLSLTATGGGTYRWDNSSTSATRTVTTAGTYSVTVTAPNGCTAVDSQVISGNTTAPTANILAPASTTLTCTTTSLSLTATGGGTYQWDNSSTSATRTVTTAGTYSVTVTAPNGCTAVDSQVISGNTTAPSANILAPASTTLTCTTTSLSLTATGGGTYRWDNSSTSATRTVTTAGTYSVTVTAPNGCTAVDSQVISGNTIAATANILAPVSTTLTCTTTSLSLTATGGGTYRWDNSSTSAIRTITTAGTYSVTVTAPNGCTGTTSTTVFSTTASVSVSNPNVTTATLSMAFSQTFTASGGVTPYSFSLVSGSLPTGLNLSPAGVLSGIPTQSGPFTITVRATDSNGCLGEGASYPLTVLDATPTITDFTASPDPICVGGQVTFSASIGNITGSYAYTLTNGSSTTTGTSSNASFGQDLTALVAGIQTFTLTVSSNGQSATATYELTVNTPPMTTLMASNSGVLTCAQSSLTLTAEGGDDYNFSGPGILSQDVETGVAVVNASGVYSVTVTNTETGCYSTTTTTVSSSTAAPSVSITPSSATLSCASPSVSLTAVGVGSVLWNTGSTNPILTVSSAGTYSVTLTSGSGCTAVASAEVSADQSAPSVSITPSSTILSCASPSSVSLTAVGVGSVLWNTGSTNPILTVSSAGTYSVTLTSGSSGCSAPS